MDGGDKKTLKFFSIKGLQIAFPVLQKLLKTQGGKKGSALSEAKKGRSC